MADFETINLRGHVPGGGPLEFLVAEVPIAEHHIPFVLIRYSIAGERQKYALRLDLDKQAFIDHMENSEQEAVARKAARSIAKFLRERALMPASRQNSGEWHL